MKTFRHALRIIREGRFTQSGIPWLRRHGFPLPMSTRAFIFDQFKRQYVKSLLHPDLSLVRWSVKPDLVSIILPVHNGQDYLQAAIESVQAQTYSYWELIVVDDGSTDRTPEILASFVEVETRLRVIRQPNRKLPAALSRGVQNAQGEFLTWTSHDNCLYPDFLERMVNCLKRHPSWDFIFANLDIIGETGQPLLESDWYRGYQSPLGSQHIHLPKSTSELNTRADNTMGSAHLYRQRVAGLLGDYSPHCYTFEDYDYWMRVNAVLTLRHADFSQPVYAYRFHDRSLTSQESSLKINQNRERLMVFDDFRRDFYLTPLVWVIDEAVDQSASVLAAELRQHIGLVQHVIFDINDEALKGLPDYWVPVVYVHLSDRVPDGFHIPAGLPVSALKALVIVGQDNRLPERGLPDWDICIAMVSPPNLPRLAKPYQGWVNMLEAKTLLTALSIKAQSHHLALIEDRVRESGSSSAKISVIICTYHRSENLGAVIASLRAQSLDPSDYEIVVVNNDPADKTTNTRVAALRSQYYASHPEHLRLVHCPLRGLSAARNAGLAVARGQVLCFLDDDATAQPTWLENIWTAFELHPEAGVIGGSIQLKQPEPKPKWWRADWEPYWGNFMPANTGFYWVDNYLAYPFGGNWCARKQAILEVGGFRTRYGRRGRKAEGGEEIVASALIQRLGYKIGIEPRASVIHHVHADRFTLRQLWRNLLSSHKAWYLMQQDQYIPYQLGLWFGFQRIFQAFWPLSKQSLLHAVYRIGIEALICFWSFADWLKRLRKPVVEHF